MEEILDIAGVGIGPFNLSVAALLKPLSKLSSCFFERNAQFSWHSGLLLPEATIQVSFLKDLVTMACPTNPYSFLSFLFAHKRLYCFSNAQFGEVTRQEFNQYLQWVSSSIDNLQFGKEVKSIDFDGKNFEISLPQKKVYAKNIILGSGLTPKLPKFIRPHLSDNVFHSSNYLHKSISMKGKRVTVVGGGQSAAEIVYDILTKRDEIPAQLLWISRRLNFLPMDNSPFTNEFFTPKYSNYFFELSPDFKHSILNEQKLASDGINPVLLKKIYQRIYEMAFLESKKNAYKLIPNCELRAIDVSKDAIKMNLQMNTKPDSVDIETDVLVVATGFEYKMPTYLEPISERIGYANGSFIIRNDFSIEWDGPVENRIYAQNVARTIRGISDPNLSLAAWRSATIINSLLGECVYDVEEAHTLFNWYDIHE